MKTRLSLNMDLGVWWRLVRPHTLNAAVMPVLIGSSLALGGRFNAFLFFSMLAASVLIQAAVNMFNEYFDYKRGLDTVASVGIGGVIVRDEMHEKTVIRAASLFFLVSAALGAYICESTTWWIAVFGSVSMGVGYFYSAGKHPIAYTFLGEIASGIFMGPMIVLISYFIQTGALTFQAVMASLPISILVAAILLANNIRDSEGDAKKGRQTLAIVLGRAKAISILQWMFITSYLWTFAIVVFHIVSPWTLLVLLAFPNAARSLNIFRRTTTPAEMMPGMKATSKLHAQFGLLFSLGIVLGHFFSRLFTFR